MAKKKEPPKVHVLAALASIEAQWQALMLLRGEAQSTIAYLKDQKLDERGRFHLALLEKCEERCAAFDNLGSGQEE